MPCTDELVCTDDLSGLWGVTWHVRAEDEEEELDDEAPPATEVDEEEGQPQLRAPGEEQQHAYGELDIPDTVN